ncbi:MAG: phosphomannomutase/phosphoglucomutase [bacterium]|nr:phosphomannomutase/phosphoglucomutase [bacterium]
MAAVPAGIFREYDIRGVVGDDLTGGTVELLGRGAGTWLARRGVTAVSVGRDVRLSSEEYRDALVRGLVRTGMRVLDLGVVTTPMLYYSLFTREVGGGVMITGSHNPPDYNGFKVAEGKSTIYGDKIQEIRRIIEAGDFAEGPAGGVAEESVAEEYCRALVERTAMGPGRIRVVVDAGNGATGPTTPGILRDLGCEVIPLHCEPDGRFPNHHPDPTLPEAVRELRETVLARGADLGIGFDGDGDRIGVVDDRGEIIWTDMLLILYARDLLARRPGSTVIFDVKCSYLTGREIAKAGGVPLMWKTGHSLIKRKMREEGALLAGEMSGHVCFADGYFGYDDAAFAACRLVQILSRSGRPLSALLGDVPRTCVTPEIRADCPDDRKFGVVRELKEYFSGRYETLDIDGVRIVFEDGWGLIRASNTQPVIVLRFEAETPQRLEEIKGIVADKLRDHLPGLSI